LLVVEFTDLEIAGATERYCARMAQGFPKVLRALNRGGGAWAPYWFAGDHSVTSLIKWHNRELRNLDHKSARSLHAGAWVARTRSPPSCLVQTIGAAPSYLEANQIRKSACKGVLFNCPSPQYANAIEPCMFA